MLDRDDMAVLRKIVVGAGLSVLLLAIGIWLYSTGKLGYVGLSPAAALWIGFIVIFTVLAALAFGIFILLRSNKNQNREDTPSMPDHIDSRTLRMIVIGAGVLVMGTFGWAGTYILWKGQDSEIALPIVIIAGVTVLLLVLGLLTFVFSILKLSNKDEALGLPSGSVRAVIALMLLVIFAIVAIFLYSDISSNSKLQTMSVTPNQVPEIKKQIDFVAEVDEEKDGKKTGNKTVYYRSGSKAAEDLAKQLIVLLGTLVTAVSSFYFGSSSIAAMTKPPASTGGPNAKTVSPTNLNPGGAGQALTITGTNLSNVANVKLTFDTKSPISADANSIVAGDTSVSCKITVPVIAEYGPWTVVVSDNANNDSSVPNSVSIGTKPVPDAKTFEPTTGLRANASQTLTIRGTHLGGVDKVRLVPDTGITIANVKAVSGTEVTCTVAVATGTTGQCDIFVSDKDGKESKVPTKITINA